MEQKTTNVNASKAIKEFKRIVIKLKDKYILHSNVTNCLLFYHEKKNSIK